MPTFDTLPLHEACASSATGQRNGAASGIYRVHPARNPRTGGEAGAREGETTQAVRRRFAKAAQALGKDLEVRRSANAVYFWSLETPAPRQAPQEPGRVVLTALPTPTTHLFTEEGVVAIA